MNAAARPTLAAKSRELTGKHVSRLRRTGRLPGVVYGHGVPSSNVSVDTHEFEQFRRHAGNNVLLDLVVDEGNPTPALVHGVQVHPVSHRPLHVDLLVVSMTEELTVDVPVITTGSSLAVEREGGTLLHQLESVRVRALPDHLPRSIEVSIESLVDFDHVIYVRDLVIPADAHLLTDPDEVVLKVLPPRIEIEEAPVVAEPTEEAAAARRPPSRRARSLSPRRSLTRLEGGRLPGGRAAPDRRPGTSREQRDDTGPPDEVGPGEPAQAGGGQLAKARAIRGLQRFEQAALGVLLEELEVLARLVAMDELAGDGPDVPEAGPASLGGGRRS